MEKIFSERVVPFSPPDIGDEEIKEVSETLRSGWITTGPKTKLLERRLAAFILTGRTDLDCDKPDAVEKYSNRVACLSSATSAEELNLRIIGVGKGDEVIVPAYTYTSTAAAAIHCGAKVIFVDIKKDGDNNTHLPEMDYDELERAITPNTKAIVAVDLGGLVCDYERIINVAEEKKSLFCPIKGDKTELGLLSARIQESIGRIAVLSDSAHSLGAGRIIFGEKRYCGNIADFSSFSFHAVKNFTTGEGGAATWRTIKNVGNDEIYRMYQLLSLHGQSKDALSKAGGASWEYDIIAPWYKCNMTDITASIGLGQLDRYLSLLCRRGEIVKKYDDCCDKLGILHLNHFFKGFDSSKHLYLIRIPGINEQERNKIIEEMAIKGVATNVHYKPLPMMTAYGGDISDYPNSYDYYRNLVTLPLHTLMSDDDVDYVCNTVEKVVGQLR